MDFKSVILILLGTLICLYAVITMQFMAMIIVLVLIAILWYVIEKIIPALITFLNNIQRIADNLEEIKIQLKSEIRK